MATRKSVNPQPDQEVNTEHVPNILEEAHRLTSGARNDDYGHPRADFTAVAEAFNAYLRKKYPDCNIALEAEDVPMFQICVKMMRQAERPKRDNLVDIAGYARCAEMVIYD